MVQLTTLLLVSLGGGKLFKGAYIKEGSVHFDESGSYMQLPVDILGNSKSATIEVKRSY